MVRTQLFQMRPSKTKGHAHSHFRLCYCCNWGRASEEAADGREILGILGRQSVSLARWQGQGTVTSPPICSSLSHEKAQVATSKSSHYLTVDSAPSSLHWPSKHRSPKLCQVNHVSFSPNHKHQLGCKTGTFTERSPHHNSQQLMAFV